MNPNVRVTLLGATFSFCVYRCAAKDKVAERWGRKIKKGKEKPEMTTVQLWNAGYIMDGVIEVGADLDTANMQKVGERVI